MICLDSPRVSLPARKSNDRSLDTGTRSRSAPVDYEVGEHAFATNRSPSGSSGDRPCIHAGVYLRQFAVVWPLTSTVRVCTARSCARYIAPINPRSRAHGGCWRFPSVNSIRPSERIECRSFSNALVCETATVRRADFPSRSLARLSSRNGGAGGGDGGGETRGFIFPERLAEARGRFTRQRVQRRISPLDPVKWMIKRNAREN